MNCAGLMADDAGGGGLLVLDEPTARLGDVSIGRLFDVVRRVRAAGYGVLFVSHDLDEVLAITDRVTVLRDGRVAGGGPTRELGKQALVEMIVGRPVEHAGPSRPMARTGAALADIRSLAGQGVRAADFVVGAGETLGLTGLIGSGFAEAGAMLAGALAARAGTLRLDRTVHKLPAMTSGAAIAAGIAYVPAQRLGEGCIGELTVAENLSLPVLRGFVRAGVLRPAATPPPRRGFVSPLRCSPARPDAGVGGAERRQPTKGPAGQMAAASPAVAGARRADARRRCRRA